MKLDAAQLEQILRDLSALQLAREAAQGEAKAAVMHVCAFGSSESGASGPPPMVVLLLPNDHAQLHAASEVREVVRIIREAAQVAFGPDWEEEEEGGKEGESDDELRGTIPASG